MNFGIIAAGEGSRLSGEGITLPKPLVEINGEPMIGRLLRIFGSLSAGKVAVVTNAERPETAAYLRDISSSLPFELIIKEAVTPSSMHTFALMGEMLRGEGRFIATTVDTIFNESRFREYVDAYSCASPSVDGMMALTDYIDDEKPLYVEVDDQMHITAFRDNPWEGVKYISAGVYGLNDAALDILQQCIGEGILRMRNYQRALVEKGCNLLGMDIGKVIDVDHAEDVNKAEGIICQR